VYQLLSVLAIVFAVTAADWAWFRHRTDSMVTDLESQITLLKLRAQELKQQMATLRTELIEKRIFDSQEQFPR